MRTEHRLRRIVCIPGFTRIDWHRYVHHYSDGDRRFVNQFHFIRDARPRRSDCQDEQR